MFMSMRCKATGSRIQPARCRWPSLETRGARLLLHARVVCICTCVSSFLASSQDSDASEEITNGEASRLDPALGHDDQSDGTQTSGVSAGTLSQFDSQKDDLLEVSCCWPAVRDLSWRLDPAQYCLWCSSLLCLETPSSDFVSWLGRCSHGYTFKLIISVYCFNLLILIVAVLIW